MFRRAGEAFRMNLIMRSRAAVTGARAFFSGRGATSFVQAACSLPKRINKQAKGCLRHLRVGETAFRKVSVLDLEFYFCFFSSTMASMTATAVMLMMSRTEHSKSVK